MLALAGATGGMFLGEIAVGTRWSGVAGEGASHSRLSANPNALVVQGDVGTMSCPGCPDSYGVAASMRAGRESRMNEAFRELGAVDADEPIIDEPPDDEYRYGGRFPDPAPAAEDIAGRDDSPIVPTRSDVPADDRVNAPPPVY